MLLHSQILQHVYLRIIYHPNAHSHMLKRTCRNRKWPLRGFAWRMGGMACFGGSACEQSSMSWRETMFFDPHSRMAFRVKRNYSKFNIYIWLKKLPWNYICMMFHLFNLTSVLCPWSLTLHDKMQDLLNLEPCLQVKLWSIRYSI